MFAKLFIYFILFYLGKRVSSQKRQCVSRDNRSAFVADDNLQSDSDSDGFGTIALHNDHIGCSDDDNDEDHSRSEEDEDDDEDN